jgi:alanyl-tRNA synthetase
MTHRLYYTDSYVRDFEAAVVDRVDEGRRVYLDRTAFYPTSGGQPFDTGQLGGIDVVDVVDEGERIAHILKAPQVADTLVGRINWQRRFDHMQQHTGQHLLSAVIAELLGHATVGVHVGQEASTLDLDAVGLPAEQVSRVEARANEVVTENRPVWVTFEEADSAGTLRKASDRTGTLRIVTIRDLDRSACGGTHVQTTGEIGAILIRRVERARKGVRMEFLCGARAIRRARTDHELLGRMAVASSASAEELPALMEAQRGDLKEANAARHELRTKLDSYRARELYAATEPNAVGVRHVIVNDETEGIDGLRGIAQAFATLPKAVFVGSTVSPPAVLLAASPDSGINAGGVLKSLLVSVGGRGGGSATMAQGTVPGREQLGRVLESIGGRVGSQESEVRSR